MKKFKIVTILCLALVLFTGCGKEKTMNCKRTLNQNGASFNLQYEVIYTGKYVDRIKSIENVTSDSEELLENYRTAVLEIYKPFEDVEYYDYNVNINGHVLTSTTDIDYTKIDTAKLIEIDSANSQIIKDGKVKLDDVVSLYKTMGIICEK